eukprot:gene14217-biopygen14658
MTTAINWILDGCCGVGSTSTAALRCGLNAIGFDEDQYMVSSAQQRLTNFDDDPDEKAETKPKEKKKSRKGKEAATVEQQFQRQFRDCEVVTVDILPKWQATCTEDILHWNYKLYPRHHFDVIWASPPCKEYSKCTHTTLCPARATLGKHENASQEGISAANTRGMGSAQAVYAIPRALLHHLFCELKLGERMKEENALAVMDLISTLTARTDESEIQDTEAS